MSKKFDIDVYQSKLLGGILQPSISTFIHINNSFKNLIHNTFLVSSTSYFDTDWLNSSIQYSNNLPKNQKYILFCYSMQGDIIVNQLIRFPEKKHEFYSIILNMTDSLIASQLFSMFITPFPDDVFTDKNTLSEKGHLMLNKLMEEHKLLDIKSSSFNIELMDKLVNIYIADLQTIIKNGPRITQTMIVFRGIKKDYLKTSEKPIQLKGFTSVTYDLGIANTYKDCCIYEFVVMEDTPCIAVGSTSRYPKESEIIIDMDVYAIVNSLQHKFFLDIFELDVIPKNLESTNILSNDLEFEFTNSKNLLNTIVNPELTEEQILSRRCFVGHTDVLTKTYNLSNKHVEYIVKVNKKLSRKHRRFTIHTRKLKQLGGVYDEGIKVIEDVVIPPEIVKRFREFEKTLMD